MSWKDVEKIFYGLVFVLMLFVMIHGVALFMNTDMWESFKFILGTCMLLIFICSILYLIGGWIIGD